MNANNANRNATNGTSNDGKDGKDGQSFGLTKAGYDKLQAELRDLEARYPAEEAEFHDVNYSNDPSKEEAAYVETRTSLEHIQERIGHLRLILQRAVIIDDHDDPLRVDPGERVTVWDFRETQEIFFDLLGPEEVIAGRRGVTIDSPVGKALIGAQVGDVIDVQVPDGTVSYAVRKIERIPAVESPAPTDRPAATVG